MILCERVQNVGGARLLVWLRSIEDHRLRSDLLQHVMFCSKCSHVHREALSLLLIDEEQKTKSWPEILFTPLIDWVTRPAIPVPTYGSDTGAGAVEQEWSLEIPNPEGRSPTTITLVRDEPETLVIKAEANGEGMAYALRGFSAEGKILFDAEVGADGIPVVTDLHGDLTKESEIEIIALE